ncbi:MAG: tetratricopeptide repeat protein [Pseudobdellovibrionaceae bacterium]
MKFFLLFSFLLCTSCAAVVHVAKNENEDSEITNAEKLLQRNRFEEARILYKEFQGLHPNSKYYQAARLGEAQAFQGLGRYKEAVDLERSINLATVSHQPEIAALAWYYMSFAFESLGEDEKAVAALHDAQKFSQYLEPPVGLVEIPARLAAAYGRQGLEKESHKYLSQVDQGIIKVRSLKGYQSDKDWLGKAYVQIGSSSTNQLSAENFSDFVRGQKWVQLYLIKAMHLNDSTWSPKAQKMLQDTYRDLYTQFSASTNTREMQKNMGGDLFDLLDQAELYKPYADQPSNTYETAFFSYLAELRKQTENTLYGITPQMSLTEESEKLNGIKRAGRFKVDTLLPEEKKSTISYPPKVVPSKDPNL